MHRTLNFSIMLSINQLTFHYKNQPDFIENLSLHQVSGCIVGLIGKNGAGKTTLLNIIAGLLRPQSGSVQIEEFIPFDRHPDFLADLYVVPEEFYLPQVSINFYLKATASLYPNFDEEKFNQILFDFELDRGSKLHKLSHGQRKKFLLAFALATNCKLLVLDEPTNGLDIPSKTIFRKSLISSVTDDQLVFLSTHQVKDIETILDAVIVLDQGRLIFNDSLEHIALKWQFSQVSSLSGLEEVIYSEKCPGGYKVVLPASNDMETEVDIELLFKAILHQKNL